MKQKFHVLLIGIFLLFGNHFSAHAQLSPEEKALTSNALITDKATDKVHLDVLFNGAEMLLFGFSETAFTGKDNLLIEVKGPNKSPSIYRNIYLGLINLKIFYDDPKDIPSFYGLYDIQNTVTAQTVSDAFLNSARNLRKLETEPQNAIAHYLKKNQFYQIGSGKVKLTKNRLFKLQINLPESAPAGEYRVRYVTLKNGKPLPAQYDHFILEKVGTERALADLANKKPLINAIAVLVCGILFTHGFNFIFRKI